MSRRVPRVLLALSGAALLSACAGGGPSGPRIPVPEDYGIYAIMNEDELRRLDGTEKWEVETWNQRADLPPSQQFVVYDPMLSDRDVGDVEVEIWRVAWVRSAIRDDGSAAPVEGSQWAVAPLERFRVPMSLRRVVDHPDMLHLVPRDRLRPGLYALQLRQGSALRNARFGVQWNSVDRRDYSASHCVDRRAGSPARFQPCTAGPDDHAAAGGPRDFAIRLDEPVKTAIAGRPLLIVQGTITNRAAAPRRVPMLQATLQDRQGTVLHRLPFAPHQSELAAGQSAPFRIELEDPPPTTARVNIDFAADSASAQP